MLDRFPSREEEKRKGGPGLSRALVTAVPGLTKKNASVESSSSSSSCSSGSSKPPWTSVSALGRDRGARYAHVWLIEALLAVWLSGWLVVLERICDVMRCWYWYWYWCFL